MKNWMKCQYLDQYAPEDTDEGILLNLDDDAPLLKAYEPVAKAWSKKGRQDIADAATEAAKWLKLKNAPPEGLPMSKSWDKAGIAQVLREAAEDPTITHAGWISGEDMARWATGAGGNLPGKKTLEGLQQHADKDMPSVFQKMMKALGVKDAKLERPSLGTNIDSEQLWKTRNEIVAEAIKNGVVNMDYGWRPQRLAEQARRETYQCLKSGSTGLATTHPRKSI